MQTVQASRFSRFSKDLNWLTICKLKSEFILEVTGLVRVKTVFNISSLRSSNSFAQLQWSIVPRETMS
jgi:hypothetical protein